MGELKIVKVRLAFKKIKEDAPLYRKLIGWWTKSKYCHVEIIIDTVWISSVEFKGVHVLPLRDYNDNYAYVDLPDVELTYQQYESLQKWIMAQEGKRYDYLGLILSQILNINLGDDNKWFCSEIVSRALQVLTYPEAQLMKSTLVSPGKLAKLYRLET